MIETNSHDAVTRIVMGRELDGRVLYRVAAYLVDGLLIDTGCRHTAQELLDWLRERPVSDIINTHYHEDHIGGNRLIQQNLDLPIWAHPRSINLIKQPPRLFPYQELVWGYPEPAEILPLPGDTFRTEQHTFQVMEAPGHSEDHVVLIEPDRGWCFSGDLFVSEKIKVLRPEEEIGEIMRSMEKLLALGHGLVLFTSIGKIVSDGRAALRSCLDYLNNLGREAGLMRQEGLTENEIVERVFGGESSLAEMTNGQFAAKNLIRSLLKVN